MEKTSLPTSVTKPTSVWLGLVQSTLGQCETDAVQYEHVFNVVFLCSQGHQSRWQQQGTRNINT